MSTYTNLYENVSEMIKLLMEVKDTTYLQAYNLLHISPQTHARWKTNDNTKKPTIQELIKQYNLLFTPRIKNESDLKSNCIVNMSLINPVVQKHIDRFSGNYYIYYYSDHYKNEIHGGMLGIYSKEGANHIKMINGIRDTVLLDKKEFLDLFSKDNDSLEQFVKFKESIPLLIDRRSYYYYGHASIRDNVFTLNLSGTEHRLDHTQFALFDLQRINAGIDKSTGKIREYRGGLGLMVSFPNAQHRSIRAYRIGISRWRIAYDDPELKILLKQNITDYCRATVVEEDDRRWYDLMVRYEEK